MRSKYHCHYTQIIIFIILSAILIFRAAYFSAELSQMDSMSERVEDASNFEEEEQEEDEEEDDDDDDGLPVNDLVLNFENVKYK